MSKKCSIAICLAILAGLSGCGQPINENPVESASPNITSTGETTVNTEPNANEKQQKQLLAMDTVFTLTAYGSHAEKALSKSAEYIQELENLFSIGIAESEVSRLNAQGEGNVSQATAEVLARAKEVYGITGGLFDFTIYPLVELWGFPSGEYYVPTREECEALLPLVDGGQVELSAKNTVKLGSHQRIDLGGIAKGYTSSKLMDVYLEEGVTSGMVSLGGNIQVLGTKPDGSPWRIGIQDPQDVQGAYLGILSVVNKAVVTSGGYERFFEQDGKTYIHIIDPRTGAPAESDLLSVSIISDDGTLADGLSTALYIMGQEVASQFWQNHREKFDIILVNQQREVYVSAGISEDFQTDETMFVIS